MTDKIINFYDKLGLIKNSNLPKTWKKHHIYNNSMILCLGGTGSGKSNALVNYIQRSSSEFYKIIICSFSTTDEPLYKMLESKNVELIKKLKIKRY
jgi:Tfp pilus assembly pilus retraction ATPase PilT